LDEDLILIERVLSGDITALSKIIAKYQNIIYSYLLKMCLSREDAEDMTQEVFIKFYNNLYKFDRRCKVLTWMFKIAINTFRTEYRKRKNRPCQESDDALVYLSCNSEEFPEHIYERKESLREISELINALDFDQKNALLLKYIHGFSYREVGEVLGISESAAKMKAQRAKKNICRRKAEKLNKRGVISEMELPY
jgi:RNA polymerase sigma-70 factor (ECF subfamily)